MGINIKSIKKAQELLKNKAFATDLKRGVEMGKSMSKSEGFQIRRLCVHVCHRYSLVLSKLQELDVCEFDFGEGFESVEVELKELRELIAFHSLVNEVKDVGEKKV